MDRKCTLVHLARSVRNAAVLEESAKLRASMSELYKALEDVLDPSQATLPLLIEVASCLVNDSSESESHQPLKETSLPQEVVSIAVRCLSVAGTVLSDSCWQASCASTGPDATELARTSYAQLRHIARIRAQLIHWSAADAASLELLEAHLPSSSLLQVAELYWWSVDEEPMHRHFLNTIVKHPLHYGALNGSRSGSKLASLLQDLIRCVQCASSESLKAATATCFCSWFEEWVSEDSKVQLSPSLLKSALAWLHEMYCQQWQATVDGSCMASAFSQVKAVYLKHLLELKQHEAALEFLHASKSEFAEFTAATAHSDLSVQLSCILRMNQDGGWQQIQNALSRSPVLKHDQIHLVIDLVVKHVNDQPSGTQANVLKTHLSMLHKTFNSSQLIVHLGYAAVKLLRAWDCMSSCSKYAETWLHNLVKQETDTILKLNTNDEGFKRACCSSSTETAAELMVCTARDLMEACLYDRASCMLATATEVNPLSITCVHTALQGRMLLSSAIATAPYGSLDAPLLIQKAIDCFQTGVNLGAFQPLASDGLELGKPFNAGEEGTTDPTNESTLGLAKDYSSIKHRDTPSQMETTRFVLYHVLVCILSGDQKAASAAIEHLQKVEGITMEYLQLLKRIAAEQKQHATEWRLNTLILESKLGADQASVLDRAEQLVEDVSLLAHTMGTSDPACTSTKEMVQGLLNQLSVIMQSAEELAQQMEATDHEDYEGPAKVFLSGLLLLNITAEINMVPREQVMKLLDHLLGSLITLCSILHSNSLQNTILQPTAISTILGSIRALSDSNPGNEKVDCHMVSICKSVLELMKTVVAAYGFGKSAFSDLDLSCLGWFACQNILAARSCGGMLNVHCKAFAEMQLPDALEELSVFCCDIVAEQGTACSSGALEMAANCTWCMATWASQGRRTELRRLCSCATSIHEVSKVYELSGASQHRVRMKWADLLNICNSQLATASVKGGEDQGCVQEMLKAMSEFLAGQR